MEYPKAVDNSKARESARKAEDKTCIEPRPENLSVLESAASLLALGSSPKGGSSKPESLPNSSPYLGMLTDLASQPNFNSSQVESANGRLGASAGVIGKPSQKDVLCGRGRGFFNHPGNRRMLDIVDRNKGRYRAAGKTRKTAIVREVTDEIQAGGTQFLKRSNSNWYEVSGLDAHKKVCHCLREEKSNPDSDSQEAREVAQIKKEEMVEHLTKVKRTLLMDARVSHNALVSMDRHKAQDDLKDKHANMRESRLNAVKAEHVSSDSDSSGSCDSNADSSRDVAANASGGGASSKSEQIATRRRRDEFTTLKKGRAADMLAQAIPGSHSLQRANENGTMGLARPGNDIQGEHDALQVAALRNSMGAGQHLDSYRAAGGNAPPADLRDANGMLLGRMPHGAPVGTRLLDHHPGLTNLNPELSATQRGTMAQDRNEKLGIVVGEPRSLDILFGIDPAFHIHRGNMYLRTLIQSGVGYTASPTEKKLLLARGIVTELKMAGSRFLTRQSGMHAGVWYQIGEVQAETLIFRCLQEEEIKMQTILAQGAPLPGRGFHNLPMPEAALSAGHGFNARHPPTAPHLVNGLGASSIGTRFNEHNATNQASDSSEDEDSSQSPLRDGNMRQSINPVGKSQHIKALVGASRPDHESSSDSSTASEDDAVEKDHKMPWPSSYDVVCGRGRGNFRHPGNRRLLRLFQDSKNRYRAATKTQKTMIGREIVDNIKGRGGRFLKRGDDGVWFVVSDKTALRKVCHGIRDIPKDTEELENAALASDEDERLDKEGQSPQNIQSTTVPLRPKEVDASERVQKEATDVVAVPKQNEKAGVVKGSLPSTVSQVPPPATSAKANMESTDDPREIDILCGRGRGHFGHPGNRRMLSIIHQNKARYKVATKAEKGAIAREILDEVNSKGARFLKREEPDSDTWNVVEYKEALNKVCHGIRDSLCNYENKKNAKNALINLPNIRPKGRIPKDGAAGVALTVHPDRKRLLEMAIAEEAAARNAMMTASMRNVRPRLLDGAFHDAALSRAGTADPYLLGSLSGRPRGAPGLPPQMLLQHPSAGNPNMTPEEAMILARFRRGF